MPPARVPPCTVIFPGRNTTLRRSSRHRHYLRDEPCSSSKTELERRLFLMLQGACSSRRQILQVHAQILLHGFSHKNSLLHKLISRCVSLGDLAYASLAFELARHPSATVWNQLIRGFARSPAPHVSVMLYNRLLRAEGEERPNGFTYSFLLNACSRPSLSKEGEQVHARIVTNGFGSSVFVQTSLLNMYAAACGGKRKAVKRARRVFDDMTHRNVASWNSLLAAYLRCGNSSEALRLFEEMPGRDRFSWTTVIAGCAQLGRPKLAMALLRRMEKAGVDADQVTMVAALSACADLGDLESGQMIHSRLLVGLKERRHCRLVSLDNSLINMYAKCGSIHEACMLFEEMPQRDTVSWTTMIMGFVIHGRSKDALALFQRMEKSREMPDEVTFMGVLCACGHLGKVEEGWSYLKHMTEAYNIKARIEHYGCVVHMLSRAGRLEDARKLVEEDMPMKPNDVVWGALMSGCRTHGDLKVADYASSRLLELGLSGTELAGHLTFLSNLYATNDRWETALTVRKTMAAGARKPAGRSWVWVHGVLHVFTAGDRNGQCSPDVYNMLREITKRAELAGLKRDKSQVRVDVEEEEQEPFLYLHSEKLAMAFALINVQDKRRPIRILSNLRMCSDCHSIAEFVSHSFGKDIIIRERSFFHHFSKGTCSCKL